MNLLSQNVYALLVGFLIGCAVNMVALAVSGITVPMPVGVDLTTLEGLQETVNLFEPRHFIFPFLGHAVGTLAGASATAAIAASYQFTLAIVLGVVFLVGGIADTIMFPVPAWFAILDLGIAFLPMAWFGGKFNPGRIAV